MKQQKKHQLYTRLPLGSSVEDGHHHEQEHISETRRQFLKTLGLTSGASMVLGGLPVTALLGNELTRALAAAPTDRVLVLIQMKGGNDGLNTIIPLFDYTTYQNLRPDIHVKKTELIELSKDFGIPKVMGALEPMFQNGAMKVVHGVGYQDQNLSHFRSTDIWASASDSDVSDASGWLGRYILNQFPDISTAPPEIPPAIQIGSNGIILFNDKDNNNAAIAVTDPEELYNIARTGQLYDTTSLPDCVYGEQLGYMRTVANNTFKYAEKINEAFLSSENKAVYADKSSTLGFQLSLVARLIKGGLGTKLYLVSIDGFDNHANQDKDHPPLLHDLANAVGAFYQDLAAGGYQKEVLCATFSEFGRRPEQNGSTGTDHGAAAPVLLFGPSLNGNGFIGSHPSLTSFDNNGNLKFGTDFRSLYASLLEYWLCIDSAAVDSILGRRFNRMTTLGLDCIGTDAGWLSAADKVTHQLQYDASGRPSRIVYHLPYSSRVTIQVFNILGQQVLMLEDQFRTPGDYWVNLPQPLDRIPGAVYTYRIQAGQQAFSGKMRA